jgi:predicted nucleotidyltransferase
MPKMGMKITDKKQLPRPATKVAGRTAARPVASNLASALFSTTQQRVFKLLFGQPHRSFFATELIGLTGSGSGAVQRELQRLTESGLVTVTHLGTQKHFQANPNAPVFAELRGIVLKTVGLVEPLKAALLPMRPQVQLAVVYGSIAKGSDTASSDIDLLIVSDELTLERLYGALAPAERELARKISPTLYTTEEFRRRRKAKDSFVTKVLTGEHIVLVGDERGTATAG